MSTAKLIGAEISADQHEQALQELFARGNTNPPAGASSAGRPSLISFADALKREWQLGLGSKL